MQDPNIETIARRFAEAAKAKIETEEIGGVTYQTERTPRYVYLLAKCQGFQVTARLEDVHKSEAQLNEAIKVAKGEMRQMLARQMRQS